MSEHILIFCQSSKDLKYTLEIYTKNIKKGKSCSIIVREVIGIFNFIKTLNLDLLNLVFMKTYSLKTPLGLIKQLHEAKYIIQKCNDVNYDQVYYFSNLFDVSTPYIINSISSKKVFICDHFKRESNAAKKLYFAEYIRKLLIRAVFSLKTNVVDEARYLFINNDKIVTDKIFCENVIVDPKYMLKPQITKAKNILFLDSNDQLHDDLPHAEKYFERFYLFFKSLGYHITVKGHPRRGLSKYINSYNCSILDFSIPSEFIETADFDYIFTVCSASIVSYPKEISFSLIGYFKVINEDMYSNYLKKLGMLDTQFVANEKELARIFVV